MYVFTFVISGVIGIHYGGSNNGVIPPNSNEVVVIVTSSNPFDRDVNIGQYQGLRNGYRL